MDRGMLAPRSGRRRGRAMTTRPWSYRPNDDEACAAAAVARRRNGTAHRPHRIPDAPDKTADDIARLHYQGALAEIAVARMLNRYWTGCGKGAHGVLDVGGSVDVRSIAVPHRGLVARDTDPDDVPCVLVHVDRDTRVCTALGWAFYRDVKRNGEPHGEDPARRCWILSGRSLYPMDTLLREARP